MQHNDNGATQGSGTDKFGSFDILNRVMAGRYHNLFPRYKDNTLELLSCISRGENGYNQVVFKSDQINNATSPEKDYWRSLTAAVQSKTPLHPNTIANHVCAQKARYGHPRLVGNIHQQCIAELYKAFIVTRVILPGADGKRHTHYIIRFALLVE